MRLGGSLWKSGKHWLVEVPALDAMTQGRTRADAVRMIEDLVATMADTDGFSVEVRPGANGLVVVETTEGVTLEALVLRRQR